MEEEKTGDLYLRTVKAQSRVGYWWAKEKAIEIGRLKTIRAPKFFKEPNVEWQVRKSITQMNSNHVKNVKYMLEKKDFFKSGEVDLQISGGGGQVIFEHRDMMKRQTHAHFRLMVSFITMNSNIPKEFMLENFLVASSPFTRRAVHNTGQAYGFNCSLNSIREMSKDFDRVDEYVEKLQRSLELAKKVYPFVDHRHYSDWNFPSVHDLSFEFTGVEMSNLTLDSMLKSEIKITHGNLGHEDRFCPGQTVAEEQRLRELTQQEVLNRYIQQTIVPRSENDN